MRASAARRAVAFCRRAAASTSARVSAARRAECSCAWLTLTRAACWAEDTGEAVAETPSSPGTKDTK